MKFTQKRFVDDKKEGSRSDDCGEYDIILAGTVNMRVHHHVVAKSSLCLLSSQDSGILTTTCTNHAKFISSPRPQKALKMYLDSTSTGSFLGERK